jgi:MFS superfamily sulfate permease-like transporter
MALSPRLPVFTSLRGYRASWLRGDVIAGLTVWAVLVPEALAYASIAGVSPVVGLYAAPGALILYATFGSSKHLVVGPMAATAALSAAAVGTVAAGNNGRFAALTATLAITTGILALAAGLLRLGFLARLVIARDVGQVRDVLASSGDDAVPEHFPSVRAAVDAVRADPAGQVAGATSTVKES